MVFTVTHITAGTIVFVCEPRRYIEKVGQIFIPEFKQIILEQCWNTVLGQHGTVEERSSGAWEVLRGQ